MAYGPFNAGCWRGVTSFNGRTGNVTPQNGDYTASQVGAIPTSAKGSANGVASLGNDGKVPSGQLPISVSATGTATETVQYITIGGVEKKLPSGGGSSAPVTTSLLKGDGTGGISEAVKGKDYVGADTFAALGLSVVNGKLCQTYSE